jgi:LacI family transcriptional regulator
MAVTIKKIAEIAGVSAGTVDRALNNRSRVKPEVAERIRALAKELNYQPNSVAKSLSIKNKGLKIAVILHITKNSFFDEVIQGIKKAGKEISDSGIQVVIKVCKDFDANYQLNLIEEALNEDVKAIAIVPINHPMIKNKINDLTSSGFPVVLLTSIVEDTNYLAYVGCDYRRAGRILAGLINLITKGKANLGVLSPTFQMCGHLYRVNSMCEYLSENYPEIHVTSMAEVPNDEIGTYMEVKRMMDAHPDIDTLLYGSSTVNAGFRAIQECIGSKPIRIISLDLNESIREQLLSGKIIATLIQNPRDQGYKAIRILVDYLTRNQSPKNPLCYVNTEIIVKECIKDSGTL